MNFLFTSDFFTKFIYVQNSLWFPLLLHGMEAILSSVREITPINSIKKHIILLESNRECANDLFLTVTNNYKIKTKPNIPYCNKQLQN